MKPLGLKTDCTFSSTDNPPDYEEHASYFNWFCYDVVTDGRMDQLTDRRMEGWTNAVEPRNNGFEGTKHGYPLLPKSIIANIKSKRKKYQGTKVKFAIVRFFTTLGCIIARFHCMLITD